MCIYRFVSVVLAKAQHSKEALRPLIELFSISLLFPWTTSLFSEEVGSINLPSLTR